MILFVNQKNIKTEHLQFLSFKWYNKVYHKVHDHAHGSMFHVTALLKSFMKFEIYNFFGKMVPRVGIGASRKSKST